MKVLIAPLNWGLGHATRTMPVINYCIEKGHDVILASSGEALDLLKLEYPQLKTYVLPDYGITYPTANMYWNLGIQLPKMSYRIFQERKAVARICELEKIDLLIADNRFGAAQKGIPSIEITHHLHLPLFASFAEYFVDVWIKLYTAQFDQIWIPDHEGSVLSGILSSKYKSANKYYIGPLSRLKILDVPIENRICIVLSGPEPQRSIYENRLLEQLKDYKHKTVLVRGITTEKKISYPYPHVEMHNYMTSVELNKAMCASEFIISRSGYSTILDLTVLGKKAILVPTPGQPEQEYLAKQLEQQKLYFTVPQSKIDIARDIEKCKAYSGFTPIAFSDLALRQKLDSLLDKIIKK